MPLVSMKSMMAHAMRQGYGLGYFEAWDSYSMEAVLEAAEEECSPVILGFGGMMADTVWLDNAGVQLLGAVGAVFARRSKVPVCLLLNEAQSMDQVVAGMAAGFNAVMLDTSSWQWQAAVDAVTSLVDIAHPLGVTVEAELGRLPDATPDGIDRSGAFLTDPDQAAMFVEATGVDCLAVSIGNVHLLTAHHASVDMVQLRAIHQRISLPLVIHGGTSFPPDAVPEAIAFGAAKFNVGTSLKTAFLSAAYETLGTGFHTLSVHTMLGSHKEGDFMNAGKCAMKLKVKELMRLYGSSGQAREQD